ncbi:MAG: NAD-dependent epimerase/dehydratase family protein, partial [Candidatus Omnitrophica bacterium]|nr:NAD-dependent epimerase/dehydratase family protein [Candidatus Omnitrophota bacterium]
MGEIEELLSRFFGDNIFFDFKSHMAGASEVPFYMGHGIIANKGIVRSILKEVPGFATSEEIEKAMADITFPEFIWEFICMPGKPECGIILGYPKEDVEDVIRYFTFLGEADIDEPTQVDLREPATKSKLLKFFGKNRKDDLLFLMEFYRLALAEREKDKEISDKFANIGFFWISRYPDIREAYLNYYKRILDEARAALQPLGGNNSIIAHRPMKHHLDSDDLFTVSSRERLKLSGYMGWQPGMPRNMFFADGSGAGRFTKTDIGMVRKVINDSSALLRKIQGLSKQYAESSNLTVPNREKLISDIRLFTCYLIEEKEKHRQLRRDVIKETGNRTLEIDSSVKDYLGKKTILITGAAGVAGSKLCDYILTHQDLHPRAIVLTDIMQAKLEEYVKSIGKIAAKKNVSLFSFVADLADRNTIEDMFEKFRPQVVFHVAAQRVPGLGERFVIKTMAANSLGTKNLAELADKYEVERFIYCSTGKARHYYDTRTYTITKKIAEEIIQMIAEDSTTRFGIVRFHQVITPDNDLLKHIKSCISNNRPVSIYYQHGYRMPVQSLNESVVSLLNAGVYAKKAEIFGIDRPFFDNEITALNIALYEIKNSGKDLPLLIVSPPAGHFEEFFPGFVDQEDRANKLLYFNYLESVSVEKRGNLNQVRHPLYDKGQLAKNIEYIFKVYAEVSGCHDESAMKKALIEYMISYVRNIYSHCPIQQLFQVLLWSLDPVSINKGIINLTYENNKNIFALLFEILHSRIKDLPELSVSIRNKLRKCLTFYSRVDPSIGGYVTEFNVVLSGRRKHAQELVDKLIPVINETTTKFLADYSRKPNIKEAALNLPEELRMSVSWFTAWLRDTAKQQNKAKEEFCKDLGIEVFGGKKPRVNVEARINKIKIEVMKLGGIALDTEIAKLLNMRAHSLQSWCYSHNTNLKEMNVLPDRMRENRSKALKELNEPKLLAQARCIRYIELISLWYERLLGATAIRKSLEEKENLTDEDKEILSGVKDTVKGLRENLASFEIRSGLLYQKLIQEKLQIAVRLLDANNESAAASPLASAIRHLSMDLKSLKKGPAQYFFRDENTRLPKIRSG